MTNKPLIVLTNDDGIGREGIETLYRFLKEKYRVIVIAPEREKSAGGHALTLHKPLRVYHHADDRYSISGTPVDCINLAIKHIVKDPIDLVVSGINEGANLGDDVFYSGTVAAALEAANFGLAACAVSLVTNGAIHKHFKTALYYADIVIEKMLHSFDGAKELQQFERAKAVLNVNVPNIEKSTIFGVKITRLGQKLYSHDILVNTDPTGRKYYWIGGRDMGHIDIPDSDCNALVEKYVSITPLVTDITHESYLGKLREWKLGHAPR